VIDTSARENGCVARIRHCASCGARLPKEASVRRRYCDDVCRAQAYRERQTAARALGLALMLGDAEHNGDTGIIRLLTCPECGEITFAGGGRRRDAVYCSDLCRSTAWRRRAARRAKRRA
jgi:predicted nucleic acid-binding Zn ribbon protein